MRHSRQSSRSAAAASAEPPPMPDATGKFLVRTIRPPAVTPAAAARTLAARSTEVVRLSGKCPGKWPLNPQ